MHNCRSRPLKGWLFYFIIEEKLKNPSEKKPETIIFAAHSPG